MIYPNKINENERIEIIFPSNGIKKEKISNRDIF